MLIFWLSWVKMNLISKCSNPSTEKEVTFIEFWSRWQTRLRPFHQALLWNAPKPATVCMEQKKLARVVWWCLARCYWKRSNPLHRKYRSLQRKRPQKRHLIFYNCRWSTTDYFPDNFSCKCSLILLSLIHQYELGRLSQEKYEETLLFLYDFFICYTIIGQENSNKITNAIYKNSSILENHYSDSALECFISELKNKLPSKEVFLKAFSNLGWSHHAGYYDDDRNKERVQVVLEVLERYKCASKQCAAFTIEHILDDTNSPENGIIGNLIPLEDA